MLRKIALLTLILANIVCAEAQMKFGVHVEPLVSFSGSSSRSVSATGSNLGVALGLEGEYYFNEDKENYAFTFGLDFSFNKGGSLQFKTRGQFFPNSNLDRNVFVFNDGSNAYTATNPVELAAGTEVNYSISYLELPVGIKLRTNELGQSYVRAFFHLPIAKIMVPLIARGTFQQYDATGLNVADKNGYVLENGLESHKEPNIYKDVVPVQVSIGGGIGAEYAPNADGGLRITAGLYYDYGLFDITKGEINMLEYARTSNDYTNIINENPHNPLQNIALRIGVIF